MFCPNCGNKLEEGIKFCTNCGYKITNEEKPVNEDANQYVSQNVTSSENSDISHKKSLQKPLIIVTALVLVVTALFFVMKKNTNTFFYENVEQDNYDIEQEETIQFGLYPQSDATGSIFEPIEWIVLEKDYANNKMLLLSKYVIDCKPYHIENIEITWNRCFLREWLNGPFYEFAFNELEKSKIITSHLINYDGVNGAIGGLDTDDKIFCLGTDQAYHYFSNMNEKYSKKKAKTIPTNYAKNVDLGGEHLFVYNEHANTIDYDGNCSYWLRTPGESRNYAARIQWSGNFDVYGTHIDNPTLGVRPALWVSIENN